MYSTLCFDLTTAEANDGGLTNTLVPVIALMPVLRLECTTVT